MPSAASEAIQCTHLRQASVLLPPGTRLSGLCLNAPIDRKLTTSQGSPLILAKPLLLGALPNVELPERIHSYSPPNPICFLQLRDPWQICIQKLTFYSSFFSQMVAPKFSATPWLICGQICQHLGHSLVYQSLWCRECSRTEHCTPGRNWVPE